MRVLFVSLGFPPKLLKSISSKTDSHGAPLAYSEDLGKTSRVYSTDMADFSALPCGETRIVPSLILTFQMNARRNFIGGGLIQTSLLVVEQLLAPIPSPVPQIWHGDSLPIDDKDPRLSE